MTYEPPSCPDAMPPYVYVSDRTTVSELDHCKRCGATSSVFWHPFSYGCGRDRRNVPEGGQFFQLCDQCFLSYAGWLARGRSRLPSTEEVEE